MQVAIASCLGQMKALRKCDYREKMLMSHLSVPLPGETLPSASGKLLLLLLHPGRLGDNVNYYVYVHKCTYRHVHMCQEKLYAQT